MFQTSLVFQLQFLHTLFTKLLKFRFERLKSWVGSEFACKSRIDAQNNFRHVVEIVARHLKLTHVTRVGGQNHTDRRKALGHGV